MNDVTIDLGPLDQLPIRGALIVRTLGANVAVFRCGDDSLYAIDDRCPHKGGPLSQGIVHGRAVTCPLHNWVIDLAEGAARAPDSGCVRKHPVALGDDGVVRLTLPAQRVASAEAAE